MLMASARLGTGSAQATCAAGWRPLCTFRGAFITAQQRGRRLFWAQGRSSVAVAAAVAAGAGVAVAVVEPAAPAVCLAKTANEPLARKHRVSIVAGVLRNAVWEKDPRCRDLPTLLKHLKAAGYDGTETGCGDLIMCFYQDKSPEEAIPIIREEFHRAGMQPLGANYLVTDEQRAVDGTTSNTYPRGNVSEPSCRASTHIASAFMSSWHNCCGAAFYWLRLMRGALQQWGGAASPADGRPGNQGKGGEIPPASVAGRGRGAGWDHNFQDHDWLARLRTTVQYDAQIGCQCTLTSFDSPTSMCGAIKFFPVFKAIAQEMLTCDCVNVACSDITFQMFLPDHHQGVGGEYRKDKEYLRLAARRIAEAQRVCFEAGLNMYVETHIQRVSEDPGAFVEIMVRLQRTQFPTHSTVCDCIKLE
eukprot:COSAG02_NODE_2230_length_9425_cov_5.740039_8_plen_417_part_00